MYRTLSDQLVVLSALNDQNVKGTRDFLKVVGVLKNDHESGRDPGETLLDRSESRTHRRNRDQERPFKAIETALGRAAVNLSYHPQLALQETIFTRY